MSHHVNSLIISMPLIAVILYIVFFNCTVLPPRPTFGCVAEWTAYSAGVLMVAGSVPLSISIFGFTAELYLETANTYKADTYFPKCMWYFITV